MAQKIKTAGPYLLILFLVGLLIGFNFWTARVEAGDTSATQVTVGNADPVVSSVSLNGGNDITLTENMESNISLRALITDPNGCSDVGDGSIKAFIFQDSQAASCSADVDDCYQLASCSTDATRNDCTGSGDTSLIASCSIDIWYFAVATDGSSSDSSDKWTGTVVAFDAAGADHAASNTSQTIDVILSRALEASSSIDYVTVSANDDTGASPIQMGIENTGNSGINPLISATQGLECTAGGCDGESIATANQHFASISIDFGDIYNASLSETPDSLELALPKPTDSTYPVDDTIFWGLGIEPGQSTGDYTGVNAFTASGD